MAGYVKADRYRLPGVTVLQLWARDCPVTHSYAEVCMQYDPHNGAVAWCPFMYGLHVRHGGWHVDTARTPREAASIMAAADDAPEQNHAILCLRQRSESTDVGAIRRH